MSERRKERGERRREKYRYHFFMMMIYGIGRYKGTKKGEGMQGGGQLVIGNWQNNC